MIEERELRWVGSSHDDLLAFPAGARRDAGFQLGKVQAGIEPTDWKPFTSVDVGTFEIRIRDAGGIFRVLVVARFDEAVYVLHCFQKKSQSTSRRDKDIAATRYRAVASLKRNSA